MSINEKGKVYLPIVASTTSKSLRNGWFVFGVLRSFVELKYVIRNSKLLSKEEKMNTSSTPSRKKEKDGIDPNSPQSLIKSFLKAKLPDFKMEEKQKIQHQFPALFEESQFLDTSDTFLSETSSVSSSIVLSLPESFEASHSQPLLFSPKTKAKYDIAIQKVITSDNYYFIHLTYDHFNMILLCFIHSS